jgi:hypothetical protein
MNKPLPFASNPLSSRPDVERLLRDLVDPIVPHFSPGCAEVRLGENRGLFGDPAGWLEGFARPLWGLVPLAAGGGAFPHWELWQRGLASGTDPRGGEYWGVAGDYDQRSVEQAAIGFAMAAAPEIFWEPLDGEAKRNLAAWLQNINKVKLVESNWLYFRVLVNLGLRKCGQAWSQEQIDADFELLDGFHLENGWYEDGAAGTPWRNGRLGDYYVPMAFHVYSLIFARLAPELAPERAKVFVERARLFAEDFQYWFDAEGAALPFGRSLTYRFAQGSFWGALAYAGIEALPWGVMKGLYLRHLRWWMRQPIFTETGLLTIGYACPNLVMAESYNSSQSPYWALKAFLPLALPPEHPFWQAEEEPLPARKRVHTVPGAKLILVTDPRKRDVTAINPGQPTLDWPRNAPHKYSKCAYSTRFGFCVPASVATPTEGGLDNGLALSDDGRFFKGREFALEPEVREGVAYSRWMPWEDVEVRTWLIAEPACHIRIHQIQTGRKVWGLEGGFATVYARRADATYNSTEVATVRTPDGASGICNLMGERTEETADQGANSHVLGTLSSMPVLRSIHEPGEYWLGSWVSGSADPGDDFAEAGRFTISQDAAGCHVRRDGRPWWSRQGGGCGISSAERQQELLKLS